MSDKGGPKLDLVKVIWWDAQDLGQTWAGADVVDEFANAPCEIHSIGYLVKQTKAYVTLAADYVVVNGDYGRVTKIPKPWVRKVEKL